MMILVNTDYIEGKKFEMIGIAKGATVRARHLGTDIMGGLKNLVGGEITGYMEMLSEARAISTKRMVEDAEALGADAVINVRYTTSSLMQGAAEIMVYGTAVKFVE